MIPALQRYGQEQAAAALRIFQFKAALSAAEWAEQVRRMKGGGRYRFSYAPYQREMMETPFRPDVQMTAYMIASRMGKTEVCLNIMGHAIAEAPRNILNLWPTIKHAELHSKETIDTELFEPTPCLQGMLRGGRRDTSNTILHKLFPGGRLTLLGSNAGGDLARAKGNLLMADEVDKFETKVGDEGDQLKILWMRGSEYPDCIKIACSYPSIKGKSKITDIMEASDYRKFYMPCAKCGEPIILLREHIQHPEGKPEKAEIETPCCGRMITDKQRRKMLHNPDSAWKATRDFNGTAGFWGNGMLSPHPVQKGYKSHLHWIAQEAINAELADNPDRARQVIVTKFDAEPFQPETIAAPDANALQARAETYNARDMLPEGVWMVTAGVDVQDDRLEIAVWGWGENKESWMLEYHRISGSYDDPATWAQLDAYLEGIEFRHPIGVKVKLRAALVDSGNWGTIVRDYTVNKARSKIYACHGVGTINAPVMKDPMLKGVKGVERKARDYPIGVNQAKDILYRRFSLSAPVAGKEPAAGYVHFYKSLPASFYEGLTCEIGMEETFQGEQYTRYKNPPGKRNEPLDLAVYAFAASRLGKVEFEKKRLERKAGKDEKPVKEKKSYLGGRSKKGSWLKG